MNPHDELMEILAELHTDTFIAAQRGARHSFAVVKAKKKILEWAKSKVPDAYEIQPIEAMFPYIKKAKTATEISIVTDEYERITIPFVLMNNFRTATLKALEGEK